MAIYTLEEIKSFVQSKGRGGGNLKDDLDYIANWTVSSSTANKCDDMLNDLKEMS